MAGEWLKVELALPDKPEIHYIANALNLDPDAVVGKLLRVWAWFDLHTEDGNAFGVTVSLLDRITRVTGFGEAMLLAGWIEQRDKVLHMPHFDRHTSESSKKRALTAKRVQQYRVTHQALPREEKRREELKPKPIGPSPLRGNGSDPTPVIEKIPLNDGTEYDVHQSLVTELDRLYPSVDSTQTLKEIRGWCLGNPSKRKTIKGVDRFITSWFAREQNRG